MASKQHGVVSIDQLRRFGLSEKAIARRVDGGLLHRVHRGVYAAGHLALAPEGRWLAAVLALGGGPRGGGSVLEHWGAAVSHRSALSLWSLLPVNQAPCDVIVAGNGGRARRAGIRVHRSLTLVPGDVTLHRGIPVTTPSADDRGSARSDLGSPQRRDLQPRTAQGDPPGKRARPADRRQGRQGPDPQRPGGGLPAAMSPSPAAATRGQRSHRPLSRRLPMARDSGSWSKPTATSITAGKWRSRRITLVTWS